MESEALDSLLHWIDTFKEGPSDFVENPILLIDGVILSKVYNALVGGENPIDAASIKQIKGPDDWVSMMMNMRQIYNKIASINKQNGFELSVDMNALTHRKDLSELPKFLKNLLFFSVKSPNRKQSIMNIKTLEKQQVAMIESILKEISPRKEKQAAPSSTSNAEDDKQKNQTSDPKMLQLDMEIKELKAKKQRLDKEVKEAEKKEGIGSSDNLNNLLNDATRRHQQAKEKRDKLKQKLEEAECDLNKSRAQLDELKPQQELFMSPNTNSFANEKSNEELKVKLESLQAVILNELKADPKVSAEIERNPPTKPQDYIEILGLNQLDHQLQDLKRDVDSIQKNTQMKEIELKALSQILEEQNNKSALTLRKRIAQLNKEIDSSPIGDAKRLSIKYQRVIQKLESEIESLCQSYSDMEVEELKNQLAIMAKRKAREGDLLAKKQALIQATAEQCGIRLERLKLNVALQMHSSRVSKWKDCFAPPT